MKAHKMYPLPLKPGYKREALIEFSYDEFCGLYKLIGETLKDLPLCENVILNLENRDIIYDPVMSCIYNKNDETKEKYTEFMEKQNV